MQIIGLKTVHPEDTELIDNLANMVGQSFLEEQWFATWLQALDSIGTSDLRKQEIASAAIRANYMLSAAYGCCFTLPDHQGALNVFRKSDLKETSWHSIEEKTSYLVDSQLTEPEKTLLSTRLHQMRAVSDTGWPKRFAGSEEDYIYLISVAVDTKHRGSGTFGRLFKPLLAHADAQELTCYLDCYTDRLEQLYHHYGFQVIERKNAQGIAVQERCMMRTPQSDKPLIP